tara:strand:+ start:33 stop:422 length:390 start_codon:yes stop_codon:yes gene_type:complete
MTNKYQGTFTTAGSHVTVGGNNVTPIPEKKTVKELLELAFLQAKEDDKKMEVLKNKNLHLLNQLKNLQQENFNLRKELENVNLKKNYSNSELDLSEKESKYLLGKLHPDRNNGSEFAKDLFIKIKGLLK